MNEINKIKVNGVVYDITAPSTYTPGNGININNGEISIDTSAITPQELPEWASLTNKPEYNYKEIIYTKGNTPSANNGVLTLDGTNAVYKVVSNSNIAGISFSTLPLENHSCHVFFMAQTAGTSFTVNISNSSSMQCPEGQDIVITVPANGYAEVDFMNVDNILLVRGI